MKFIYFVTAFIFGMVLISSCKKDDDESTIQFDKYPRIKSIQNLGANRYTNYYEYDSKGRLIKLNLDGYTQKIEYFDSYLKYIFLDSNLAPMITYTNYLNSKGLMVQSSGMEYTYDSNGYCITSFNYPMNVSVKNTIKSGNISESITANINYATFSISIYEYSPKNNTIGNENKGQCYLGKQNINLTSRQINISAPNLPDTTNYSYEFDSKDRVIKQIETHSGNINTTLYTYY
jgi:hypothetical protein